jgi:TonB-dependent starch-binding outer membrane protein SusC
MECSEPTFRQLAKVIVLLLFFSLISLTNSFAQERAVSGRVTAAEDNSPMPGVNVLLKGTSSGTVTDLDGRFKLNVPNAESTLVFSFIGYLTEEILVGSRATIDVSMTTNISELSELVVVGYGSVEKRDMTGAMAKVDTKTFNKGLIVNPQQLIVGKVAGLQVSTGGGPGDGAGIRLRGSSLNGETPLYVVDGVPLPEGGGGVTGGRDPLNFINPADIADISVLKDASATAIYGARGANGVIMITTKSGVMGKPKLSYDGSYGLSIFTRKPDILTPSEFRQVIDLKAPQETPRLGTANTDWLREVSRPGQNTQHNITLSGGTKSKTNYYASVNYLKNQGVLRFTEHERVNLSLKIDQKLLKDNISLSLNTKNGFTNDLFGPNVIGAANVFDPTRPVRDNANTATGGFYQWDNTIVVGNPVADQEQQSSSGNTFRNITNLTAQIKVPFISGLTLNGNWAIDYSDGGSKYSRLAEARGSIASGAVVDNREQTNKNMTFEYFAAYKKEIGNHKFDITAGYAWQNFRNDFRIVKYSDEDTAPDPVVNEPFIENRLISFFGRVNYEIAGKYLITGSVRRDGSTRFGPDNRWGVFPAAAVAWRVLEENFAAPLTNIFTELKVRGSFGVTGNEQIPNYEYSTYYRGSLPGGSYQFGDSYVSTLTPNAADQKLKWEENASYNIGIDAGMLDGKLTWSLEYYKKDVRDLLARIAAPAGSVPGDQVRTNIGNVTNQGIELVGNWVAMDKNDFRWDINFNTSYNVNKVVTLDNKSGADIADFPGYLVGGISGDVGQTIQLLKVGEPINTFYVYRHLRNPDGSLKTDVNRDGIESKIEMYEDLNGDGIINEKDLRPFRQPQPKVIMGFTSNFTWKKFDAALTFVGSFGNYVYNNGASANGYYQLLTNVVTNNLHASVLETNFKTRQLFSDYYVENASFVKLNNISVGYNFDKFSFGRVRGYITVQNPLVITKYSGIDPEHFGGIENNPYPRSMTFIVGVSATFN